MTDYRVEVKPSVDRTLRRLPLHVQERSVVAMRSLATEPGPSGVVKMQGDANLWRIRVGDYRIVYEIHDATILILVLNIVHRRDIYR